MSRKPNKTTIGAILLASIGAVTAIVNKLPGNSSPRPDSTATPAVITNGPNNGQQVITVIGTQTQTTIQAPPQQTGNEARLTASTLRTMLHGKIHQPGLDNFAKSSKAKQLLAEFRKLVELGDEVYAAGQYESALPHFQSALIKIQEFDAEAVKYMK